MALWQANHVAELIRSADGSAVVEIVVVSTEGDRRLDVPLTEIGGKGVFVKEVQAAVLDGRADVAVHSAKDLPALTPDGLLIAAVPQRGDARDALVGCRLDDLGPDSVIATGSPRRRSQLRDLVAGVTFAELRGNIDSRLAQAPAFDGIVVAAAALERLGRSPTVVDLVPTELMVPQVGQATLAVECRADDVDLVATLARLDHNSSRVALTAERAFLERLGGDCDLPAGAHALVGQDGEISITAVLDAGGPTMSRTTSRGGDARVVGLDVADRLLAIAEQHGTERFGG